jgi:hypothetical protein
MQRCRLQPCLSIGGVLFLFWKMCFTHDGKLGCRLASLCFDIGLWDGSFVPPVHLPHQCSTTRSIVELLSTTGQCIASPRWLIVLWLLTSLVVLWLSILCRYTVSVPNLHYVLSPLYNRPLFPRVPSQLHCLFNAERPGAALVVHRLSRG